MRIISTFSEGEYLIPRRPHPRSYFFEKTDFQSLLDNNLFQRGRFLLERQTQLVDRIMAMAKEDSAAFAELHSLIPARQIAHVNAAAMIDAGLRVLANIAASLPPDQRQNYLSEMLRDLGKVLCVHAVAAETAKRTGGLQ